MVLGAALGSAGRMPVLATQQLSFPLDAVAQGKWQGKGALVLNCEGEMIAITFGAIEVREQFVCASTACFVSTDDAASTLLVRTRFAL